jgi:hypothetical protein
MRKLGTLLFVLLVAVAATVVLSQTNSGQMSQGSQMSQGHEMSMQPLDKASVEKMVVSWPQKPREAVMKIMTKYGPPVGATEDMVMWKNTGPWTRTIVYKKEIPHEFPAPHTDFLQQTINYRVPPDKFSQLAQFDGSVMVERTNGEMSARCDMEELNMMAINLANDIATNKRTVNDARDFYAKTAMAFKQGKTDPYLQKFQFQPSQSETATADPDKPAKEKMAMQ